MERRGFNPCSYFERATPPPSQWRWLPEVFVSSPVNALTVQPHLVPAHSRESNGSLRRLSDTSPGGGGGHHRTRLVDEKKKERKRKKETTLLVSLQLAADGASRARANRDRDTSTLVVRTPRHHHHPHLRGVCVSPCARPVLNAWVISPGHSEIVRLDPWS